MSPLYIALMPLAVIVLYKKLQLVRASIKSGDRSRMKAELFFFGLAILVILGLVLFTELVSNR